MKTCISKRDKFWLIFGAIGGFLIAFLSTGRLVVAVLSGVPSGIFGFGLWLLFLRGDFLQTKKN